MPIDRIKPRPLTGSPHPASQSLREAEIRVRVSAMFRQIEELKNGAQADVSALNAIVAQAQAILVSIQAINLELDASVAGLQAEIDAIEQQLAGLGTAPTAPTLSIVAPPVAHVAIVRVTRPNAAAHTFVTEFKADALNANSPWKPVINIRASQFVGNSFDVTVVTDRQMTGIFRAYAVSYGIPSVSAETTLPFTGPLLGPDTVSVEPSPTHLHVHWGAADDPRVFDYELRFAASVSTPVIAASNVIYAGRALSFAFPIGYDDREKSFGFWVTSRPRP